MTALVRPEVVTLCGSTKFRDQFIAETRRLTLEGRIVISVGLFGHLEGLDIGTDDAPSDVKVMLDELHKRKIDISDRIHVINVNGYIGTSTRGEIEYARQTGKAISYAFGMWPPSITEDSDTAMAHEPVEWLPTATIDALLRDEVKR